MITMKVNWVRMHTTHEKLCGKNIECAKKLNQLIEEQRT